MKPENFSKTIAFIFRSQFSLKIMIPCPLISGICTLKRLGCFKDKSTRAIDGGVRLVSNNPIFDCKNYARTNAWTVFAVQFSTECFTAANAVQTYNKYGKSDNCKQGRGGDWASDVYEVICEG